MFRFVTPLSLVAIMLLTACGPGNLPPQKVGKPYVIGGKTYYPAHEPEYDKTGVASWYGPGFHGKYTASGEVYDQHDMTAAHTTLPMPSLVRVTNLENGKSAVVRVNDRGPFAKDRLIDLSRKSAKTLGIRGLAKVRVQYLERETQEYVELVKQNGGKIIPMSDYNNRAMNVQVAEAPAVVEPTEEPVAAPVLSVASTETRGGPVRLVRDAAAEENSPLGMRDISSVGTLDEADKNETLDTLAPSAAAAPPEPMGGYTIQAGVFTLEKNAKNLASRFPDALIDQVQTGGRSLWRVTVGSFLTHEYAGETLNEVRAIVPDARVVRR